MILLIPLQLTRHSFSNNVDPIMSESEGYTLPPGLLLSVAGARGIVGESIDEEVVSRLGAAFCSILESGPLVIGRDTRPSGESLKEAAIRAARACGRECIDLGIATTPTVEMMVTRLGAAGGMIVTASHNPVQWNALKFLDHRGIFITKEMNDRLRAALRSTPARAAGTSGGARRGYEKASEDHIEAVLSLPMVDEQAIAARSFKVVIDCINGAGSVIAPDLLGRLGVEVVELNCKTDGDFHRDPEPRPANLRELEELVASTDSDLGFALDPDADRLALVSPARGAVSEEYTLALAVDCVLSRKKGPVVVNLSTSSLIEKIAGAHGVELKRTPVGEAHVVNEMLSCDAVIGGEGNGGVILPELHPGRDGILAMALILQFLCEKDCSLDEALDAYPDVIIEKKKVPLGGSFDSAEITALIEDLKPVRIDTGDGVRADFDDGWFHVRVSNTEGVVRVIAESSTDERTEQLIASAGAILDKLWAQAGPGGKENG